MYVLSLIEGTVDVNVISVDKVYALLFAIKRGECWYCLQDAGRFIHKTSQEVQTSWMVWIIWIKVQFNSLDLFHSIWHSHQNLPGPYILVQTSWMKKTSTSHLKSGQGLRFVWFGGFMHSWRDNWVNYYKSASMASNLWRKVRHLPEHQHNGYTEHSDSKSHSNHHHHHHHHRQHDSHKPRSPEHKVSAPMPAMDLATMQNEKKKKNRKGSQQVRWMFLELNMIMMINMKSYELI